MATIKDYLINRHREEVAAAQPIQSTLPQSVRNVGLGVVGLKNVPVEENQPQSTRDMTSSDYRGMGLVGSGQGFADSAAANSAVTPFMQSGTPPQTFAERFAPTPKAPGLEPIQDPDKITPRPPAPNVPNTPEEPDPTDYEIKTVDDTDKPPAPVVGGNPGAPPVTNLGMKGGVDAAIPDVSSFESSKTPIDDVPSAPPSRINSTVAKLDQQADGRVSLTNNPGGGGPRDTTPGSFSITGEDTPRFREAAQRVADRNSIAVGAADAANHQAKYDAITGTDAYKAAAQQVADSGGGYVDQGGMHLWVDSSPAGAANKQLNDTRSQAIAMMNSGRPGLMQQGRRLFAATSKMAEENTANRKIASDEGVHARDLAERAANNRGRLALDTTSAGDLRDYRGQDIKLRGLGLKQEGTRDYNTAQYNRASLKQAAQAAAQSAAGLGARTRATLESNERIAKGRDATLLGAAKLGVLKSPETGSNVADPGLMQYLNLLGVGANNDPVRELE